MKEILLAPDKKSEVAALAQKYGISLLMLFGSQATGKTHERSDADFAFASQRKLSPREIAEMAFELTALTAFPRIELVDVRDAPPMLLRNIATTGIAAYEAEALAFARFKIYAIKRFMEAKKLFTLRAASLDAFLAVPSL